MLQKQIHTANLKTQYLSLKKEIQEAIDDVLNAGDFINGEKVKRFESNLAKYLDVKHVIACGNGTDALQIALMALNLKKGDEVIVPAFTYAATVEVISLLQLTPVFVDVEADTFNLNMDSVRQAITPQTRAVIPVHLFGQSAHLEPLLELCKQHAITIVEDNAQATGTIYKDSKGIKTRTGTVGHIGCTSFFPTKNLGCYGDGGALTTNNDELAERIRMICNHGQSQKYHHEILGVNSRLDTIQASILLVKLQYLDQFNEKRYRIASRYSSILGEISEIVIPKEKEYSSHIYHQYTIRVLGNKREVLKRYLAEQGIFTTVYYPVPAHKQNAYKGYDTKNDLSVSEQLVTEVLSLPIYPELTLDDQDYIINHINQFYNA